MAALSTLMRVVRQNAVIAARHAHGQAFGVLTSTFAPPRRRVINQRYTPLGRVGRRGQAVLWLVLRHGESLAPLCTAHAAQCDHRAPDSVSPH
jgi:hypothetical protein